MRRSHIFHLKHYDCCCFYSRVVAGIAGILSRRDEKFHEHKA